MANEIKKEDTAGSVSEPGVFEFAGFMLDQSERILRLSSTSQRINLPDKAFDTLAYLVRNPSRLISKKELLDHVWADSFVEENNLNKSIHAIRRALGESSERKFIETVKKHGYRFVSPVTARGAAGQDDTGESIDVASEPTIPVVSAALLAPTERAERTSLTSPRRSRRNVVLICCLVLGISVAALLAFRPQAISTSASDVTVSTLAVLPLKPFDVKDNYLGLGVADAIIRRVGQTGTLTVRPTSSVRRYLDQETDALAAAKDLGVDAVLEGTILRSGEKLRVAVNLIRAKDGRSLWSDNFDMDASDAFLIQDRVAQQVAASLKLRLDPMQQRRFDQRYTPNSVAYEYYLKGLYSFDQRGFYPWDKPQHETTVSLFKKSIEADPDYAMAHAELAYAYAWMGIYIDENAQEDWIKLAKEEVDRANAIDPEIAETHVALHHILLSASGGFQIEAATRELLKARRIDPTVGSIELAVAYFHLGLEEAFEREVRQTMNTDPTSAFNKQVIGFQYLFAKKFDDWLAFRAKYDDGKPNIQYLLGKGRFDEAKALLPQLPPNDPRDRGPVRNYDAFFAAVEGRTDDANSWIDKLLKELRYKNRDYHHQTYEIACLYALISNGPEAVKWLRETAITGFPCYPLFMRDHWLDRIRDTPEFEQFLAEMKARHEQAQKDFEN